MSILAFPNRQTGDHTYAAALEDWQQRFDLAKQRTDGLAVLAMLQLMSELQDRLRPDIWERNHR